MVRVVALVLLKREHPGLLVRRRIIRVVPDPGVGAGCKVGHHRIWIHLVVLDRVARLGRRGGVRHPQRRRVRVHGHRRGEIHEKGLVAVDDAVAVGVGLRRAHHPRILHRVVGRVAVAERRHHRPARPAVAPPADLALVGLGDHVVRDHAVRRVADMAEQRVEAVEDFVVVVHAVTVRVEHARIRGAVPPRLVDIAQGELRTQHHAVAVVVVVHLLFGVGVLCHEVPPMRRTREVAEFAELPGARRWEAGGLHLRVERLAVHDVHRHEREELARLRRAVGHPLAHERRVLVVVTEMAQGLHEVFLEVLEPVMVEIEVALRARVGVDVTHVREGIARLHGRFHTGTMRSVHAARDVGLYGLRAGR